VTSLPQARAPNEIGLPNFCTLSSTLVEYAITTYNGTPHTELNNVTPLGAIEYYVSRRQTVLKRLAEDHSRPAAPLAQTNGRDELIRQWRRELCLPMPGASGTVMRARRKGVIVAMNMGLPANSWCHGGLLSFRERQSP
jgi:hypothetical protein